jgi:hypothetical protein
MQNKEVTKLLHHGHCDGCGNERLACRCAEGFRIWGYEKPDYVDLSVIDPKMLDLQ